MKKAVDFDMDGVLVDSQPLHFQADLHSLKKHKVSVSLETVIPNAGMSNPDRWAKYKQDFALAPSVETLIKNHVTTVDLLLEKEDLKPIAGIVPLLAYLQAHKIPVQWLLPLLMHLFITCLRNSKFNRIFPSFKVVKI